MTAIICGAECMSVNHTHTFVQQVIYTSIYTACVVCCGLWTISNLSVSYFIFVYFLSHSEFQ